MDRAGSHARHDLTVCRRASPKPGLAPGSTTLSSPPGIWTRVPPGSVTCSACRPSPAANTPAFGTHNRLLSLGPTDYLKILAVNPRAEATGTAYPLGLGLPEVRERLTSGPILLTWVVRVAELAGAGVREVSRGAVRWRALPREDGSLPCGGALPAPIQWLTAPPWTQLPDRGIRLRELVLNAPNPHQLQTHVQAVVGAPLDCRITLRQGPISSRPWRPRWRRPRVRPRSRTPPTAGQWMRQTFDKLGTKL